jgi:hypothetical protein
MEKRLNKCWVVVEEKVDDVLGMIILQEIPNISCRGQRSFKLKFTPFPKINFNA